MTTAPVLGRARGMRRAPAPLRRRAALRAAALRVGTALRACSAADRTLLALLLVERLTPGEAARALGLEAAALTRRHRALLARLRRALAGVAARRARGERRAILPLPRVKAA